MLYFKKVGCGKSEVNFTRKQSHEDINDDANSVTRNNIIKIIPFLDQQNTTLRFKIFEKEDLKRLIMVSLQLQHVLLLL